jgi:hypothetical protein
MDFPDEQLFPRCLLQALQAYFTPGPTPETGA